jgi:hypothetical protein
MRTHTWLAPALALLGAGIAAVAVLGPLVLGLLEHRTSPTTANQLLGADLAGLVVVAPFAVAVAVLAWRRHPAAPVLALAPGAYAAYTFTQYAVGQEYLDAPGNVERFFPLLLAVFVLGAAVTVGAWTAVDPRRLPALSRRLERTAAVALLFVGVFLVFGLHLPMLPDALSDTPTRLEYVSSPTAFWLVKFMDLGILVPAALTVGVALLRSRPWARRAAYAILGGYTLIGVSVAAMAIVMLVRGDPDGSVALAAVFTAFAAVFATVTAALYRPLFQAARTSPPAPKPGTPASRHMTAA